jgi:amino acid transporter
MQSAKQIWTGRMISWFAILFFTFDGVTKMLKVPQVIESTAQLGIPERQIVGIGILLLACTLIYMIPQTSVFGAILLTAYLGAAVAIHLRSGSPLFPIIFTVTFGVLVWLGLYLREPRLYALVPLKKSDG